MRFIALTVPSTVEEEDELGGHTVNEARTPAVAAITRPASFFASSIICSTPFFIFSLISWLKKSRKR